MKRLAIAAVLVALVAIPAAAGAAKVKIPDPKPGSVELVAVRVKVGFGRRVPPVHVVPNVPRAYRPNQYALLIGDRRLSVSGHTAIYIVLMEAIYPVAGPAAHVASTTTGTSLEKWVPIVFGSRGFSAVPYHVHTLADVLNSTEDDRFGMSQYLFQLPDLNGVTFGAKSYGEGEFDWGLSKQEKAWSIWGDLGLSDQALSDTRPKIESELGVALSPPTVGKEFRCVETGLATNLLVPPVRQGDQPDIFTLSFTVKCENDQFGFLKIDLGKAIGERWSPTNATPPNGWTAEGGLSSFSFKAREPLSEGQSANFQVEMHGNSDEHPQPSGSGFPLTAGNHASQDVKDFKEFDFST